MGSKGDWQRTRRPHRVPAGEWSRRVSLPAKSGVGGSVFSPRLDATGNSVRGQLCCIEHAEELGPHALESTNIGSSFLRSLHQHERGGKDCLDGAVVAPKGRTDSQTAPDFLKAVNAATAPDGSGLVIDFADESYISSAG